MDLILSNCCDTIDVMVCESISDHCLICADIDLGQTNEISQTPKEYIRDFTHADYEAFNAYLQGINWYEVFSEATNVYSRWVAFTSIFNAGISACISLEIAGNNEGTRHNKYLLIFIVFCSKKENNGQNIKTMVTPIF